MGGGEKKLTGPPTYPAPMQQILSPSWDGMETIARGFVKTCN